MALGHRAAGSATTIATDSAVMSLDALIAR
jgi:hypothetical protein